MKKILVITDSLGLPRGWPEVCEYEETWPTRLRNVANVSVHQLSIGGATLKELQDQLFRYHLFFKPDIVIIQSGVVDCAPRAFTKNELIFFNSTKVTKLLLGFLSKHFTHFFRKNRNISYTKIADFEKYALKIHSLENIQTFWIGITPVSVHYEMKVPGMTSRVVKYNTVLKNIFKENFLSTDNMPANGLMSDFFHLNNIGNDFIYSNIMQIINA